MEGPTKSNPISLLPDGSVLKDVLIPRYDEDRRLVGDLKAETMTLMAQGRVEGENVLIKFYERGRILRGKITLQNGLFSETESLVHTNEDVEFTNNRLIARGNGLVYAFQTGEGFLRGPVSTWVSNPAAPETSMHTFPRTDQHLIQTPARQSMQIPAFIALCLAPSITLAAPPANVSDAELTEIKVDAESQKEEIRTYNEETKAILEKDLALAKGASKAAERFVQASKLKLTPNETGQIKTPPKPEPAPLKVEPSPQDTVINCDDGMYFDAEAGILVYLGNVRVKDPRFKLSGADELRVFFEKKEPKTEPKKPSKDEESEGKEDLKQDEKPPEPPGPGANFGDVEKIVATGAVLFIQESVDGKEPVEASGGLLTYDIPKGEIIISERFPWVKQGTFYARAKQPNLTLRLLNDGSFSTQGNWEMIGKLNSEKN